MLAALARGAARQLQHVRCMATAAAAAEANPMTTFLKNASRPKMGLSKAKQSAGQRVIDLTKHESKFAEMSFEELIQVRPRRCCPRWHAGTCQQSHRCSFVCFCPPASACHTGQWQSADQAQRAVPGSEAPAQNGSQGEAGVGA